MLRDTFLERRVRLLLQDAESGQIRWRPVLVVEGREIEALVLLEGLVGDDPSGEEEMLLLALAALRLDLQPLLV